ARVRAEAAEGGEPEGELCKCAPAFHEHDEAGAKHCRSCDAEWHPAPQPSGTVATLERGDGKGGWIIPVDVLSEIQKDAGEWADETYLETVEAIALAVERRLSALTAGKPEQSAWQPIETAPKDGTHILAWCPSGHDIVWWTDLDPDGPDFPGANPGWWGYSGETIPGRTPEHGFGGDPAHHWPAQNQPTHWLPLPQPPAEAEAGHE